jgi:hypothetical protein
MSVPADGVCLSGITQPGLPADRARMEPLNVSDHWLQPVICGYCTPDVEYWYHQLLRCCFSVHLLTTSFPVVCENTIHAIFFFHSRNCSWNFRTLRPPQYPPLFLSHCFWWYAEKSCLHLANKYPKSIRPYRNRVEDSIKAVQLQVKKGAVPKFRRNN